MDKMMVSMADIHKAKAVLRGVIHETTLNYSCTFSEMAEFKVYLKLENLQKNRFL